MRKSWRGRLRRGNDGRGISKNEFWSAPRCLSTRRGERSFAWRAKHVDGVRCCCGRGRPRSGARTSPSAAGRGGSVGKFRQASSVIAAAGADARGPGSALDRFRASSSSVRLRLVLRTQSRSVGCGTGSLDLWKRGLAELPPSVAGLLRRTGAPPNDEARSIVDVERPRRVNLGQGESR